MLFGNSAGQPDQVMQQTNGQHVFDVGTDDFEEKVIQGSMDVPVLVDFWAPWCGPCKQLGPVLEKLVASYGGKIKLAKVNLDENQQLAGALRVQSVPTVYAFFGGRPMDAFQGNMPESQLKAFIDKVLESVRQMQPDALDIPEALKGAAEALAENDLQTAHAIYVQILQADENNVQAYSGLIRVLIAAEQLEQAQHMIENAPESISKSPLFAEVKTALDLASVKPDSEEERALSAKVDADPNDFQTRYDLAMARFASGKKQDALGHLLYIIEMNRSWNEEAARHQLLKFFEAMGHADPLTIQARKKLSSILFS